MPLSLSQSRSFLVTGSVAALMASASFAHAAEGFELFEKLTNKSKQSDRAKWESIEKRGNDSFTIKGITLKDKKGKVSTISSMVVDGLTEGADGTVSVDGVVLNGFSAEQADGGTAVINNIRLAQAVVPAFVFAGEELTAENKKQRVKFGQFSINGVASDGGKEKFTLDTVKMLNADIPLDYRYTDKVPSKEPIAAPLTFDLLQVTNVSGTGNGVDYAMADMSLNNAKVPTSLFGGMMDFMKLYSSMSISGVDFSLAGTSVFKMDEIKASIDKADADGTINTTTTMDGMEVNLKAIPDPRTKAVMAQLGYEKVTGSLSGLGTYNPQSGKMAVRDMVIKLNDMFNLAMDYSVDGYTEEVAMNISRAQLEHAENPSAMLGAMMSEFSKIKVADVKMALTDQSLTGRLLDFQAKQMGTTGDQLAKSAPLFVGMGMGALNMPDLTAQVSEAVGKFLENKGTLTVAAAPQEPVSVLDIFTTSQADPTKLPEMLNVKVSAE